MVLVATTVDNDSHKPDANDKQGGHTESDVISRICSDVKIP